MSFVSSFVDWMNVINGLTIPVGNLGLSRSSMPQIDTDQQDAFNAYLQDLDIDVMPMQMRLDDMRLTQNEVNKMKVWKIMKAIRQKKTLGRVWVTKDNYVVDGSHRFVAALNMKNQKRMAVNRVNMTALDFVRVANKFVGVKHRTVSGNDLSSARF